MGQEDLCCCNLSQEPELQGLGHVDPESAAVGDWEQVHKLQNLLLVLVGKVGELVELHQWQSLVTASST